MTADPRPRAALSSGTTVGSYQIVAVLGPARWATSTVRATCGLVARSPSNFCRRATRFPRPDRARGPDRRLAESSECPRPSRCWRAERRDLHRDGAVDGESLRGATPPLRKSLDIAAQIADGLSAAHAAGVMHRDLKPDNVMVTRDGRVKLLDFGVAKSNAPSRRPRMRRCHLRKGVVTGTLGYMAPEQVRAARLDGRAPTSFSFGAVPTSSSPARVRSRARRPPTSSPRC